MGIVRARFIEPMLLQLTTELPEGPQWLYELKLDGYRAIAFKTGGKVRLRSRNDKDFTARYPVIASALSALPDETVIDGEVVAMDETDKPSFNLLQNFGSSKASLIYYVFDVLIRRALEKGRSACTAIHQRLKLMKKRRRLRTRIYYWSETIHGVTVASPGTTNSPPDP